MANYDIFNGDADGICALIQLRLAEPRSAHLMTGVKRDINLFEKMQAKSGDSITALDISMRTNMAGLSKALKAGANVFYVDHHNAGDIPKHENLFAVIDTRPSMCTSLLVNKALNGAYKEWAIVGAFGDNLDEPARMLAKEVGYKAEHIEVLKRLGKMINYNAYGRDVSDLHYAPDTLFEMLVQYEIPDTFMFCEPEFLENLESKYFDDLMQARRGEELLFSEYNIDNDLSSPVWLLEDAPWARRISGTFGNELANELPSQAHAVLTHNIDESYTVSVRAPKNNLRGADTLCIQFPTGGGRAGAAGINRLPKDQLEKFMSAFKTAFFAPSARLHFEGNEVA